MDRRHRSRTLGTLEPSCHQDGGHRTQLFRAGLVGVHWFANYPSDADLLEAHHQFSLSVTARLGDPADEQVHPIYGAARLWRTPEFTVETYAHVQRNDPPTIAALQIHVDLTGPADARNAEVEGTGAGTAANRARAILNPDGHRSVDSVHGYIQAGTGFTDDAVSALIDL